MVNKFIFLVLPGSYVVAITGKIHNFESTIWNDGTRIKTRSLFRKVIVTLTLIILDSPIKYYIYFLDYR